MMVVEVWEFMLGRFMFVCQISATPLTRDHAARDSTCMIGHHASAMRPANCCVCEHLHSVRASRASSPAAQGIVVCADRRWLLAVHPPRP